MSSAFRSDASDACTDTRTHSSFSSEKVPDYDDRKNLQGEDEAQAKHYSKTMSRELLYGAERVYADTLIAHERIVFSPASTA